MKIKIFRCQSIFIISMTVFILLGAGSFINCQTQLEVSQNKISHNKNLNSNISNLSHNNAEFSPWIIFKHFGNKTFICILYLFYQVNGFLLFFTSVGLQIILTYIIGFLKINFFQYVPIQLFETVAVLFYYGFSFGVIYTVMFGNSNAWNNTTPKKKPREFYDYYEANHFSNYFSNLAEFLKVFGLIFISFLIQIDEYDTNLIISTNNHSQSTFINFGTECLIIIVSSLSAIIIATLMNYKFHVNCILWFGSLNLMLMGTEIYVKMLSRN